MAGAAALPRVAELSFGARGTGVACLREGWSTPEEGFCWAEGRHCALEVALAGWLPDDLMVELDLSPFIAPPALPAQTLGITANGAALGTFRLNHATVLSLPVPRSAWVGRAAITLRFDMPDTASPAALGVNPDRRSLGVALSALRLLAAPRLPPGRQRALPPVAVPTGVSLQELDALMRQRCGRGLPELALSFESLGHNCEFGLVQRLCGAEPLGLLRFTGITPANLVRGLESGFAGVGAPSHVEPFVAGAPGDEEWLIREHLYGLQYHTFLPARTDASGVATLLRKQMQKLQFEQRKFLEDLRDPRKIFVFHAGDFMVPHEAVPVLQRLRLHGPARLLFVTSGAAEQTGCVAELAEGLFQGFVDALAPVGDAGRISLGAWVSVMANVVMLAE